MASSSAFTQFNTFAAGTRSLVSGSAAVGSIISRDQFVSLLPATMPLPRLGPVQNV